MLKLVMPIGELQMKIIHCRKIRHNKLISLFVYFDIGTTSCILRFDVSQLYINKMWTKNCQPIVATFSMIEIHHR